MYGRGIGSEFPEARPLATTDLNEWNSQFDFEAGNTQFGGFSGSRLSVFPTELNMESLNSNQHTDESNSGDDRRSDTGSDSGTGSSYMNSSSESESGPTMREPQEDFPGHSLQLTMPRAPLNEDFSHKPWSTPPRNEGHTYVAQPNSAYPQTLEELKEIPKILSEKEERQFVKKQIKLEKNRQSARKSRQKKKMLFENYKTEAMRLSSRVEELEKENCNLREDIARMNQKTGRKSVSDQGVQFTGPDVIVPLFQNSSESAGVNTFTFYNGSSHTNIIRLNTVAYIVLIGIALFVFCSHHMLRIPETTENVEPEDLRRVLSTLNASLPLNTYKVLASREKEVPAPFSEENGIIYQESRGTIDGSLNEEEDSGSLTCNLGWEKINKSDYSSALTRIYFPKFHDLYRESKRPASGNSQHEFSFFIDDLRTDVENTNATTDNLGFLFTCKSGFKGSRANTKIGLPCESN